MKSLNNQELITLNGGWWDTETVAGAACAGAILGGLALMSIAFSPAGAAVVALGAGLNSATCGVGLAATFVNSL